MKTRRAFLRQASAGTGGAFLAPILMQLEAQAAGVERAPRFVFVVEGNGLPPKQVTPEGFKRGNVPVKVPNMSGVPELVNESLVRRALSPSLQPIKDFQDRLTVVNSNEHWAHFQALRELFRLCAADPRAHPMMLVI